jgi:hypothetical protein
VINGDPERSYVLVHRNESAIGQYEMRGYRREVKTAGGPRIAMQSRDTQDGDFVTAMGHVLMSIEKAELAEIRANGGPLSGMGEKHWDAIEKRLLKPGGVDDLRGMRRSYMAVDDWDPQARATEG